MLIFGSLKSGDMLMIIYFTCCCLPTPMNLASGWSPIFPLVVNHPASLSESVFTPAVSVHSTRGYNVVRMWVQLKSQSGMWCKRTGASHIVVKLHSTDVAWFS